MAAATTPAVVLTGANGKTTISNHCVAMVAGLAVREVPGVHALVPFGPGQVITNLARQVQGNEYRDLGVKVEVGTKEAAVDVRIVTEYGARIPQVAADIKAGVTRRIKQVTGLHTTEVNIHVVDLWFEEIAENNSARVR